MSDRRDRVWASADAWEEIAAPRQPTTEEIVGMKPAFWRWYTSKMNFIDAALAPIDDHVDVGGEG